LKYKAFFSVCRFIEKNDFALLVTDTFHLEIMLEKRIVMVDKASSIPIFCFYGNVINLFRTCMLWKRR